MPMGKTMPVLTIYNLDQLKKIQSTFVTLMSVPGKIG